MLINKLNEIKSKLTTGQFELAIEMFKEDVIFHDQLFKKTENELCEVLVQAANIAARF